MEQLVAERAALLAHERQLADARENRLFEQLSKQDLALRATQRKADTTQAELGKATRARLRLAHDRQVLVEKLAQRDREFATEVAAYRESVTGLARAPSAEKRAALQRYADGDRTGAFAVLEAIAKAENAARAKAASVASAANLRQLTPLLRDMKDRGEKQTADVIRKYEEIIELDPGVFWDWADLVELYQEAGQLQRARAAAERAAIVGERAFKQNPSSAQAKRQVSISYSKLGDVAVQGGQLAEARRRFEQSLAVAEELAKQNPSSAQAKRDVSVSYSRLGDVAVQGGQFAEAKRRFEQSLVTLEELAKQNPSSAQAKRDLALSHHSLGRVTKSAEHVRKAVAILALLNQRGLLAPSDVPWFRALQAEVSPQP